MRFADVTVDTEEETIQAQAEQAGLTFPACNPVKRIDFIFARNHTTLPSSASSSDKKTWSVKILYSRVIGTKPSPDTGSIPATHNFLAYVLYKIGNLLLYGYDL